jgi:hypothetical protein
MWDTILKFLAPILQQTLGGAMTTAANKGIEALTAPSAPPSPGHGMPSNPVPAQGAGMIPGPPPGISGSGTTNNPTGTMNFGGGYTGGPDPRTMGQEPGQPGPQSSLPSSGFTTMGYPVTQQKKLLAGINDKTGFSAI